MKQMLVIGFAGAAGAGKDTCGQWLTNRIPSLRRIGFADPLKQMLGALPDFPNDHSGARWADRSWKEASISRYNASPRKMAQTLGTEWGRTLINDDIWVKVAARKVELWPNYVSGAVFTDARYENEASWIRSTGGTVVHILRPDKMEVRSHTSEVGLEGSKDDYAIQNNGSFEFLYEQVMSAYVYAVERLRKFQG